MAAVEASFTEILPALQGTHHISWLSNKSNLTQGTYISHIGHNETWVYIKHAVGTVWNEMNNIRLKNQPYASATAV